MAATAILALEGTIQSRALAATADKLGEAVDRVGQIVRVYNEFLNREHRRVDRDRTRKIVTEARAEAAAKGNAPTVERQKKGDLVDGEILTAGADAQVRLQAKRGQSATIGVKIAQDLIDRYAARKQITARQANAAAKYRNDYQLGILGARDPDPRDPYMVSSHVWGGSSMGEAQLLSAESYALAKKAMGEFANVVESVVLYNKTIDDLVPTGRRQGQAKGDTYQARQKRLEIMHQLRDGLDRLGDAHRAPSEIIEERVVSDEDAAVVATIRYRHEADGRVSAISFNGYFWVQDVEDIGELRRLARERMSEE